MRSTDSPRSGRQERRGLCDEARRPVLLHAGSSDSRPVDTTGQKSCSVAPHQCRWAPGSVGATRDAASAGAGEPASPRGTTARRAICVRSRAWRSTKGYPVPARGLLPRSQTISIGPSYPFGWGFCPSRGGQSSFRSGSFAMARTSSAPPRRTPPWLALSATILGVHSRSHETSRRTMVSAVERTAPSRLDQRPFSSGRSIGISAAPRANLPACCDRGSGPR